MRTWLIWIAFIGLMAGAMGGATWSAIFAEEREPRSPSSPQVTIPLESYAEAFCYGHPTKIDFSRLPDGTLLTKRYNEWDTVAEAELHLADTLGRLRAFRPPTGLEGFHDVARAEVWRVLRSLQKLDDDSAPVEIRTIGAALPDTGALNDELGELPEDLRDLMERHGCYWYDSLPE